MSKPVCKSCKCPCLLLSLKCLYDGTSLLNAGLDNDRVYAFMDSAQLTHVKPVIGEDCFTALCTALENSRLATTDPNYVALEDKWSNLLDEITELIIVATEFMYIGRMAYGKLNKHGLDLADLDLEVFKMMMDGRKAELRALKDNAKHWMQNNHETYGCVDYVDTSCLVDDITEIDDPFGYFMVME